MEPGQEPKRKGRRGLLYLVGPVAVLTVAQWLLQQSTNHPVRSLFGLFGLVAAVVIAVATVVERDEYGSAGAFFIDTFRLVLLPALERLGRLVRRVPRSRVALAVVVLGLVGGYVVACGPFTSHASTTCPHPTELKVLASSDSVDSTRDLLTAYELSTARANTRSVGCPAVHVFVYSARRMEAVTAVAHGWQRDKTFDPYTMIGPRPDLWLPDSTVDVRAAVDLATHAKVASSVVTSVSIGSSPMVIASRNVIAGLSIDPPDWPAVVRAAMGQGMGLLTADPLASTNGLFAAASYLRAAQGAAVPDPVARQLEQSVQASGGAIDDDGVTAICRFSAASAKANPAVVTSYQLWRRYSQPDPSIDLCASQRGSSSGGSVVRPADPLVLDHPFVTLRWNTAAQQSTVDRLRAWLSSVEGDRTLRAIGLDAARPACSNPDPAAAAHDPCLPVDLGKLQTLYQSVQPPGVVLLGLDTSGSMANPAGQGRGSRLAVGTAAVVQALGQIGPADKFGLWTFSGETPAFRELVPVGPGSVDRRDQAAAALASTVPQGFTPLYQTIVAGMAKVAAAGDKGQVRAMVVITDGEDTSSHLNRKDTIAAIEAASSEPGVRLFVVATGEATCDGVNGLRELTDAGHGVCFDAGLAQVANTTTTLFESLWRGR